MLLTLLALAAGAGVGLAQRSRFGSLDLAAWRPWESINQTWLLAAGVVIQAIAETFEVPARRSLLVIGLFLVIVALAGNLFRLAGAGVTIVGIVANLAALVANGHVPVRLEALTGAGVVPAGADASSVSLNGGLAQVADADTRLEFLGDIVPIGLLGDVVSFGDLIVLAGLGLIARSLALDVPLQPAAALRGPTPVEVHADDDLHPEQAVSVLEIVRPEQAVGPTGVGTDSIDTEGIDTEGIDVDEFLIDLREADLAPAIDLTEPAALPEGSMSVDELLGPDPSPDSSTPTTRR